MRHLVGTGAAGASFVLVRHNFQRFPPKTGGGVGVADLTESHSCKISVPTLSSCLRASELPTKGFGVVVYEVFGGSGKVEEFRVKEKSSFSRWVVCFFFFSCSGFVDWGARLWRISWRDSSQAGGYFEL